LLTWGRILSKLFKRKLQRDRDYRFYMIINQIGDLSKAISYPKSGETYPHRALLNALADLYAMVVVFAFNEGYSLGDLNLQAMRQVDEFVKLRLIHHDDS